MKLQILNLALIPFLLVSTADAYTVLIRNNQGWQKPFNTDGRECYCLKNTQTNYIHNWQGGIVKLFSSTDCTGNYDTLGSDKILQPAYWVNSMSLGREGKSTGPFYCGDHFMG